MANNGERKLPALQVALAMRGDGLRLDVRRGMNRSWYSRIEITPRFDRVMESPYNSPLFAITGG